MHGKYKSFWRSEVIYDILYDSITNEIFFHESKFPSQNGFWKESVFIYCLIWK